MNIAKDKIEYWLSTENGEHFPVQKGQSVEEALNCFLKDKGDVRGCSIGELEKDNQIKLDDKNIEVVEQYDREEKINKLTEYAKQNLGIEYIDISKMDYVLAKSNIEQLVSLTKEYKNNIKGIDTQALRLCDIAQTEHIGTKSKDCTISFNQRLYGTQRALFRQISENMNFGNLAKVEEKYIQISTATHEFAHSLSSSKIKQDDKFWDEIRRIKRAYTTEKNSIIKQNIIQGVLSNKEAREQIDKLFISRYAEENIDEFMAEAFTMAKLNNKSSKYAKQVLNVINKYFRR